MTQPEEGVREAARRRLRISMAAGSLYDLAFAVVNLIIPALGSAVMSIPMPADEVYLRFIGVFLVILALFYMLPVIHPDRYLGVVSVAIVGRAMGAVFLFVAVAGFGQPAPFIALGLGDLFFSLLHAWLLRASEGGNPLRHYWE